MKPNLSPKYRKLIGSSVIDKVAYDPLSDTLLVKFLSGTVWCYYEVPEDIYRSLLESSSSGRYFNINIRDKYPSSKISKSRK